MGPGWDTAQRNNIEQPPTGPTPYREGHRGQVHCMPGGRLRQETGLADSWQCRLVLGMWNVTSLAGKEQELEQEVEQYQLDIAGLMSTHCSMLDSVPFRSCSGCQCVGILSGKWVGCLHVTSRYWSKGSVCGCCLCLWNPKFYLDISMLTWAKIDLPGGACLGGTANLIWTGVVLSSWVSHDKTPCFNIKWLINVFCTRSP